MVQNHVNIERQYVHFRYGQLGNTNLYSRIRVKELDTRTIKCLKTPEEKLHCAGNITIQDFKPIYFSFSFGFPCDSIVSNNSLKGLTYNISIQEQSNETNCISLPRKVTRLCPHYQHGLLADLVGFQDMRTLLRLWDVANMYIAIFEECYQYFSELVCYLALPKCDPVSRQVIHPCREMCQDFRAACLNVILKQSTASQKIPDIFLKGKTFAFNATSYHPYCDYLPSLSGDIPCLYKSISCKVPPVIKNATMVSTYSEKKDNYSVLNKA